MIKKIFLFLLCIELAHARVTLDDLFTDNLVLQRDQQNAVFGIADEENEVSVTFRGKTYQAKVEKGRWIVRLNACSAGGPFTMLIKGHNKIERKNILMGDVWICSGQSNMAFTLQALKKRYSDFIGPQIADYHNDKIRFFKVKSKATDVPLLSLENALGKGNPWLTITPENALKCSATAYFFARKIQEETGIPIGLVIAAQGGTPAESFLPRSVLESRSTYQTILDGFNKAVKNYPKNHARYEKALAEWKIKKNLSEKKRGKPPRVPMGPNHIKRPGGLYNGMIFPLTQISAQGFIWYQGEANAHSYQRAIQYRSLFSDLITHWRKAWGKEMPFYFAQLAAFRKIKDQPSDTFWPWLREAQTHALTLPKTGMGVLTDAGKQKDIHPPQKKEAGERMALHALTQVYNKPIAASSPSFLEVEFGGGKAIATFQDVGNGLMTKQVNLDGIIVGKNELKGFTICGEEREWAWAQARIIEKDRVEIWNEEIKHPVAIRYAWADFPVCNLYNSLGLPLTSFRSDSFPPGEVFPRKKTAK